MENMEGSGQPSVLVNLFRGFKVESLGLTSTLVADVSRRSSLSSYLCNISKGISNLAPSIMMSVAMSSHVHLPIVCLWVSATCRTRGPKANDHFQPLFPPELRVACCWPGIFGSHGIKIPPTQILHYFWATHCWNMLKLSEPESCHTILFLHCIVWSSQVGGKFDHPAMNNHFLLWQHTRTHPQRLMPNPAAFGSSKSWQCWTVWTVH